MAQRIAVWHGTDAELRRLRVAVNNNCHCRVPTIADPAPPTCVACSMLADQDVLNHLVFVARQRRQFQRAELDPMREWF